jgi:uncharacterized protein YkwD
MAFTGKVSAKHPNMGEFTAQEIELLALTNKERAHKGLQPLKMNRNLVGVARDHSATMACHRHLSHTVKGKSFAHRIKKANYPLARAGENVARSNRSFLHVMRLWMKSPGHRKNILNPSFKEIGIGIATTSSGDRYFTQVFGTRK